MTVVHKAWKQMAGFLAHVACTVTEYSVSLCLMQWLALQILHSLYTSSMLFTRLLKRFALHNVLGNLFIGFGLTRHQSNDFLSKTFG